MWDGLAGEMGGEIVRLEPLSMGHADGLFRAAGDGRIWRWMRYGETAGREAFLRWVEDAVRRSEAGTEGAFATLDAATGEPIGSTRYLALRPEHRGLEIGWTWLAPSRWGSGANVEAKLLMLERAFDRLGCMRVELKTDRRNARSRRAMEALPATFEGVFRKHMILPDGTVRDSAYYSITDEDWPGVRGNLRRRLGNGPGRKEQR